MPCFNPITTYLLFIHLLLTSSTPTPLLYPELDQLYLDPNPYLNVLSSNLSTDEKPIKIPIQPNLHLKWLKQRDTAREHAHKGHLDIAKQQFQSIIMTQGALLPARVVAGLHLELGDVLLLLGDDNACHHHYLEAQAFVPTSYLPHARLAKLSTHLGHFDTAIEHYKHALFFNHSHLISLHNIGSLLFIQCKVEEAWHYFDVAIHGSDRSEDYRRVSLTLITEDDDEDENEDENENMDEDIDGDVDVAGDVDETGTENGGGRDGESRKDRILRNKRQNKPDTNFYSAGWLTAHIMYVFEDKDTARTEGFDLWQVVSKLKEVEQYSDFDRTMVISYTLNMVSYFHLHRMGLYEEAMNIWTTLHALEDAINGRRSKGDGHNKHDITSTSLLGMTFLMQYANAVPQLLNSKDENDKSFVIEEIWERREWIHERFENARRKSMNNIFNTQKMQKKKKNQMTIMEMFSSEASLLLKITMGNIASDPWAIRTLTSHITSSTLLVSSSSSLSIAAEIQFVAQKLTSWTIDRLPTLHRVQTLDEILRPPSDPSENLPFDRKLILRLAGKVRLRRKVARRKLRKKEKNNKIRVHEEIRDERAFRAMKQKKKDRDKEKKTEKKTEKETETETETEIETETEKKETTTTKIRVLDSDILPIIRVGFVCESLDSYMHHIQSPVSQYILLLLKSTVQRYHVTIYIPEWAGNEKRTEEIKNQYRQHILKQYKDDYAWFTRLSEISVRNPTILGEKIKQLFTVKTLFKNKKKTTTATTKQTYVSKDDVLVFVAPTLDDTVHYLAHTRIAPVQIGFWAGTGTSGLGGTNDQQQNIGHLDYFVTSEMIHRNDVDTGHLSYTEQRVLLPHAGTMLPTSIADLPESARSGSPVQYLYKYREDQSKTLHLYAKYQYLIILHDELYQLSEKFDDILARLLIEHKSLQILLVGASQRNGLRENSLGYGRLVARVRKTIDRLVLLDSSGSVVDGEVGVDDDGVDDDGVGEDENSHLNDENVDSNKDISSFNVSPRNSARIKQRVRHITGLSRTDYLALVAAVDVVLDPGTKEGGGTERVLLPAVETMMIGTPIVTMHPDVKVQGWKNLRPTSSVAALLQAVGGDVMMKTCVAKNEKDYVEKVLVLLKNTALQRKIRRASKENIYTWVENQNKEVETAWIRFLERVGRPYANWRVMNV